MVQLRESNYLVPLQEHTLDSKAGFNRLKAIFSGHSLTPLGSLYLTEAFTWEIVRCQPLVISATSNLSSPSCLYIESCHFRLFTGDYFGRWFGSCFHLRNLWWNCLLWYVLRHVSHAYIFISTHFVSNSSTFISRIINNDISQLRLAKLMHLQGYSKGGKPFSR